MSGGFAIHTLLVVYRKFRLRFLHIYVHHGQDSIPLLALVFFLQKGRMSADSDSAIQTSLVLNASTVNRILFCC